MSWLWTSTYAQDIGITLVHSLWQIVLVAAAFAIANRLLAKGSASLRYTIAYATLVIMLAAPLVTLFLMSGTETTSGRVAAIAGTRAAGQIALAAATDMDPDREVVLLVEEPAIETPETAGPDVGGGVEIARAAAGKGEWARLLPWVSLAWCLGVIAFSLRPCLALHRCRRMRQQSQPVQVPWIEETLQSLCVRTDLKRKVEIASSALVHVPTVLGFWRPIVLLPVEMLAGQTPQQLSAILAHELAHIRRHDFVFNLFQTAIETLLFYHPAVWWVSAVARQERENCCDDIAMSICGRKSYATALANLESARTGAGSFAMAANGGSLYRRIHRIVRPHENPNPLGRWLAALVAITALFLGVMTVLPTDAVAVAADDQAEIDGTASDPAQDAPQLRQRTYAGQVLLPSGEPAVGAQVYRIHWIPTPLKSVQAKSLARTDSEGRFRFSVQDDLHGAATTGTIVAKLDGYAFAWAAAPALELSADVDELAANRQPAYLQMLKRDRAPMRLVEDDAPIVGRVVDTEGNGMASVSVYVTQVLGGPDNTMAAWDSVIRTGTPDYMKLQDALMRAMRGAHVPTLVGETTTDGDGRFTLRGLGKNRIVEIVMHRAGMVAESVYARTSGGKTVVLPMMTGQPGGGFEHVYHGNEFTMVAEPSRPVIGQVTDEDGKGIAGVIVASNRSYVHSVEGGRPGSNRAGNDHVLATTDATGRYRLEGLPIARSNTLRFLSPADSAFLGTTTHVDTQNGDDASQRYSPTTKDVQLRTGIVVEGRVVDALTGAGVSGHFRFVRPAEGSSAFTAMMAGSQVQRAHVDGTFRITVPKAQGTLAFTAFERHKYRMSRPDSTGVAEGPVKVVDGDVVMFGTAAMAKGHATVPIRGTESGPLQRNLQVTPASAVTGYAAGPDGQRLTNLFYSGLSSEAYHWRRSSNGDLDIYGLDVRTPCRVAVLHPEKKLAGVRVLTTTDEGFVVKLRPWATVQGRIVDAEGEPLVGAEIHSGNGSPGYRVLSSPADAMKQRKTHERPLTLPPTDGVGNARYVTDADGRFEISGLVAGETYHLDGHYNRLAPNTFLANTFAGNLKLKPGEVLDLGDVVLKKVAESRRAAPAAKEATFGGSATAPTPKPSGRSVVKGRVFGSDKNRPPAETRLWKGAARMDREESRLAELAPSELTGRGEFEVALNHFASMKRGSPPTDEWIDIALFATAKGYGFAWYTHDDLGSQAKAELELVPDQPIRGRVVDTEGRPVAGLKLVVETVRTSRDGDLSGFLGAVESRPGRLSAHFGEHLPRSFHLVHHPFAARQLGIAAATTDADGRFEIPGIGRDRLALVAVSGANVRTQKFHIATRELASVVRSPDASNRRPWCKLQFGCGAGLDH